jgi:predicted RNA binding protein YcfA (HicA-like mRNA interferase family)
VAEGEKRLRCQDLLTKHARFGVIRVRQKGSHILLLKPDPPGQQKKGPTYPVPCHKPTDEVSPSMVRPLLRVFKIDEDKFWGRKSKGTPPDEA